MRTPFPPVADYHQYPRCVVGASALGANAPAALIAATRETDFTAAPLAKVLAEQLERREPSPPLGASFDGHAIMGPIGSFGGEVRLARSSYTGPKDPAGNPTFVAGSGDLDECNGAVGSDGAYRYFATVELVGEDVAPVYPYLLGGYRSLPEASNFPPHALHRMGLGGGDKGGKGFGRGRGGSGRGGGFGKGKGEHGPPPPHWGGKGGMREGAPPQGGWGKGGAGWHEGPPPPQYGGGWGEGGGGWYEGPPPYHGGGWGNGGWHEGPPPQHGGGWGEGGGYQGYPPHHGGWNRGPPHHGRDANY